MKRAEVRTILVLAMVMVFLLDLSCGMSRSERKELKAQVIEMFHHAYRSYMDNAYPADELMPISCKGRYRGSERSRGDIDDALGNYSLTLIDTLDSLVVLGEVELFEEAVKLVIRDVKFDNDIVVSVFEANIRILGGLLGGHVMARFLKQKKKLMQWYADELLNMAKDIGLRLLPAFNTTTGIPYPRVNLKYGMTEVLSRTGRQQDTCTACAGTIILEFAALSRLTGISIFEEKANKALTYLWQQRHRSSDLVGTIINIHSGDWVRRDSGVGAGIDSYYEYLLKAYILLGDETYLDRFNKHYDAIMRYINQGPLLVDVHMHRPNTNSKNFMDALLAFWPGLQVLKGDIKPAIEIHEMLYQVVQRHNFLPEAFTTDFRVHWAHHPLRPEFVESTYFLYKATGDPHYLEVGKSVVNNLDAHARVACGFASIRDVTTGAHDDQMDSYVLAETFKYLYLLFAEREDVLVDIDDYVFTTEAHLLPLTLSMKNYSANETAMKQMTVGNTVLFEDGRQFERSCPSTSILFPGNIHYAQQIRNPLKNFVENLCPKPRNARQPRLRASEFIAGNKAQLDDLKRMGIRLITMKDGRVQLLHTASEAETPEDAEDGLLFMQDMIELSKHQSQVQTQQEPRVVQLISAPYFGSVTFSAGPAQFGLELQHSRGVMGSVTYADPFSGCSPFINHSEIKGKIILVERGMCLFIDKARKIQEAGGIGGIVIDNVEGSSTTSSVLFAMSGDGKHDVIIPMVFLFHGEGKKLREAYDRTGNLEVLLAYEAKPQDDIMKELLKKNYRRAHIPTTSSEPSGGGSGTGESGRKGGESTSNEDDIEKKPQSQGEIKTFGDHVPVTPNEESVTTIDIGGVQIKVKSISPDASGQSLEGKAEKKQAKDSILRITKQDNNNRHVYVDVEKMVAGKSKEMDFQQLSRQLVGLLEEEVLQTDSANNDYLNAVKSMVEAAITTVSTLEKYAKKAENELKDTTATLDSAQMGAGENAAERQHYATGKELQEDREVRPDDGGSWVREAPEDMHLKDGDFYLDDGVMYIPPENSEQKAPVIESKKEIIGVEYPTSKIDGQKPLTGSVPENGVIGPEIPVVRDVDIADNVRKTSDQTDKHTDKNSPIEEKNYEKRTSMNIKDKNIDDSDHLEIDFRTNNDYSSEKNANFNSDNSVEKSAKDEL